MRLRVIATGYDGVVATDGQLPPEVSETPSLEMIATTSQDELGDTITGGREETISRLREFRDVP